VAKKRKNNNWNVDKIDRKVNRQQNKQKKMRTEELKDNETYYHMNTYQYEE
jgi:hypothetical protein